MCVLHAAPRTSPTRRVQQNFEGHSISALSYLITLCSTLAIALTIYDPASFSCLARWRGLTILLPSRSTRASGSCRPESRAGANGSCCADCLHFTGLAPCLDGGGRVGGAQRHTEARRLAQCMLRTASGAALLDRPHLGRLLSLRVVLCLTLAWLLPFHSRPGVPRRPRRNIVIWYVAAWASALLGWIHLWQFRTRKAFARDIICLLPRWLHCKFIAAERSAWFWITRRTYYAIWLSERLPAGSAWCYALWTSSRNGWYVGKCNGRRSAGTAARSGFAVRFREHVLNTWAAAPQSARSGQEREFRYRVLERLDPHGVKMVPLHLAPEAATLLIESIAIRVFAPFLQQRERRATVIEQNPRKRHRPWPRFRRRPRDAAQRAADRNVPDMAARQYSRGARHWIHLLSFPQLVHWLESYWQISPQRVLRDMHTAARHRWLAIYAGEKGTRLHWKSLWRHRDPTLAAAKAYVWSAKLEPARRRRAREKLLLYLRTARFVPQRVVHLVVPRGCPELAVDVCQRIRRLVRVSWARWSPELQQVVVEHIRMARGGYHTNWRRLANHWQAARAFRPEHVPQDADVDTQRSCYTWDLVHEGTYTPLQGTAYSAVVTRLLQQACTALDIGTSTDCLDTSVATSGPAKLSRVCVPIDKDNKRLASTGISMYHAWMHRVFCRDPGYYMHLPLLTAAHVAEYRQRWACFVLSARSLPRAGFTVTGITRAYLLPKRKCLPCTCGEVWACGKSHVHHREILGDVHNPLKRHMRRIARAIRCIKQLSREPGWTLWKQCDAPTVIREKLDALVWPERPMVCSGCGGRLHAATTMVRMDAATFFKNADVQRGYACVEALLDRVGRRFHCDALALPARPCEKAFFWKSQERLASSHRCVLFHDVLEAVRFAQGDNLFMAGHAVFRRLRGWPMGGSLSEPLTMCDTGEAVLRMHGQRWEHELLPRAYVGNISAVIQGVQHVDDALLLSRMLCPTCLATVVKAAMPPEYGMEIEEQGPVLRFLDLCLWSSGHAVHVQPYTPNIAYSMDEDSHPYVARFPAYMDSKATPHGLLRSLLQPRILVYNTILGGSRVQGLRPTVALVREILRLGWPARCVGTVLMDLNRVRQSEYLTSVRYFGSWLRGCAGDPLPHLDLRADWAQFRTRQ